MACVKERRRKGQRNHPSGASRKCIDVFSADSFHCFINSLARRSFNGWTTTRRGRSSLCSPMTTQNPSDPTAHAAIEIGLHTRTILRPSQAATLGDAPLQVRYATTIDGGIAFAACQCPRQPFVRTICRHAYTFLGVQFSADLTLHSMPSMSSTLSKIMRRSPIQSRRLCQSRPSSSPLLQCS